MLMIQVLIPFECHQSIDGNWQSEGGGNVWGLISGLDRLTRNRKTEKHENFAEGDCII